MNGLDKIIFLWGFMGSGKSTTGQLLAQRLNIDFVDLDEMICQEQGCSIDDIFRCEGEHIFREYEMRMVNSLIEENTAKVVSCGGGTPCFNKLNELMNNNGTTIYLDCKVATLVGRLKRDTNARPLINGKSEAELIDIVANLLEERRGFYNSADMIIFNNTTAEKSADLILKKLKY